MTELGSEVDIDLGQGEERLHYPLIVPTLTREELDELASGREPSKEIQDKALKYAIERKQKGLDPFATPEEEGQLKLPESNPQIMELRKRLESRLPEYQKQNRGALETYVQRPAEIALTRIPLWPALTAI